jgi:hypothetical protein
MFPLSIEFETTDGELLEAVREVPMIEYLRAATWLWTILTTALAGHELLRPKEGGWSMIALVGCVAALFFALSEFLKRKAIASARQAPLKVQLRVDEQKITAWSSRGAQSIQWSQIRSIRENKLLFVLIPNDAQVVLLPKRILPAEVQQWLRAYKKRKRR